MKRRKFLTLAASVAGGVATSRMAEALLHPTSSDTDPDIDAAAAAGLLASAQKEFNTRAFAVSGRRSTGGDMSRRWACCRCRGSASSTPA